MLGVFLSFLLLYKYLALFLVAFLSSIIFPLPYTALLMAAGAFSSQGYLNIYYVLAVSLAGCIMGDSVGFFVCYYWGRDFLKRIGLARFLKSRKFTDLEKNFSGHAASAIFLSRFIFTSLDSVVNILAGLAKTPFKKYYFFEVAGETIYSLLYAGLGFALGSLWQYFSNLVVNLAVFLSIAAIIFVLVRLRLLKNK